MFICTGITPSVAVDTVKQPSMPVSNGKTFYVGGSGHNNYSRIRDAIYNARDGDTIYVYSGTYYENNIVIDKSINLVGKDRDTTIIDGSGIGVVVGIYTDRVTVNNFTIQNGYFGIYLSGSSYNNTIKSNIISNNNEYGIYIVGSCYNTISDNNISDNEYGIYLSPYYDHSGGHWDSIGNTILKNNFIDNKQDASFDYHFTLHLNRWILNYWNRPRILPKLIFGRMGLLPLIPWINIDWHPALKPYKIEV